MNIPPRRFAELEELLGALRDDIITGEQVARLEELITSDPDALDFYISYTGLYATLRQGNDRVDDLEGNPLLRKPGGVPSAGGPGKPWSRRTTWMLSGVAGWALVASVLLAVRSAGPPAVRGPRDLPAPTARAQDEVPTPVETPHTEASPTEMPTERPQVPTTFAAHEPFLAVLTRVVNVRWGPTTLPTEEGATLPAGRLRLLEGTVQIEFFSGASVILEGPADFEILSQGRAFCHQGKLRTHVPPHAHGFTIGAPGIDAVDLGTEFAMRVDERGQAEVHVLEGEVELRRTGRVPSPSDVTMLKAGRSVRFGQEDDRPRDITANPAEFIDRAQLLQLMGAHHQERFRRWLGESRTLRADPAVALYYDFDGHSPWERTLRNVSSRREPALDGAIVGCLWTEGRWPGKGALEFKRPSDRVRIHVPGEFQSLTFTAWVRIEGLNQRYSALMLTDDWNPGEPHWQITENGRLLLGVKSPPEVNRGYGIDYVSPPVLGPSDLGRWVHLATSYDGSRRQVLHYVDGKPVSLHKVQTPVTLRVGSAELGNWNKALFKDTNPVRSLDGRVDEFGIFGRVLSDAEIQAMYDVGKPSS